MEDVSHRVLEAIRERVRSFDGARMNKGMRIVACDIFCLSYLLPTFLHAETFLGRVGLYDCKFLLSVPVVKMDFLGI